MNPQHNGIIAALAGAWRAIVTAFTPTRRDTESQTYGADTTLFGGLTEQSGNRQPSGAGRENLWDPNGESSLFTETETTRRHDRR